ncbi:MAG TPA: trypsin-like peptidase domain-containing protein [Vicinamibacterales bacterium]|nr:trypsin-like peptidase domain-containing protein [Vicinamibacterales bacterium]
MHRRGLVVVALLSVAASPPALAQEAPSLASLSRSLQQLADKVSPSVVQIFAAAYALPDDESDRGSLLTTQRTAGSGVILDPDGYIVTNAHVVSGAIRVQVEIPVRSGGGAGPPGRSVLRPRGRVVGAQVVAIDEETDLAVLKVEEKGLPALPIGDSDTLRPGQLVMAFGSPLGLEASVSMGVVSAVARQLEPEDPMIYIQTDAPINPGSSGGPLVDADGRLVGINTLIYSQSGGNEGIGFAAPSNIVRNVFDQVRATGRVRRGEIGVLAQTITPLMARGLALPQDWGVIIADVDPDGPGARAGVQTGDIVLSLDGKVMENGRQFRVNFYARGVGSTVTLQLLRGERRLTVRVPVAERADDPMRFAALVRPEEHLVPRLGLLGLNLDERIAQMLPELLKNDGVVVAAIAADAPVSRQGALRPGDVIHALNGRPVASLSDLRAALAALKPGDAAVLQVERDGRLMFLAFAIE